MMAFMKRALSVPRFAMLFVIASSQSLAENPSCFPTIDSRQQQYIVAYGNLLHETVREKKLEKAVMEMPVWVNGYKRAWTARVEGGKKTRLGVVQESGKQFNGVLVSVGSGKIKSIDGQGKSYCRRKVDTRQLSSMTGKPLPDKGEIWLYETRRQQAKKPAVSFPILQSEVDTFLTGCIEQAEQFGLRTFPQQCVDSTVGWSVHWNNDRYRPAGKVLQSRRAEVDKLLENMEGDLYERVRID